MSRRHSSSTTKHLITTVYTASGLTVSLLALIASGMASNDAAETLKTQAIVCSSVCIILTIVTSVSSKLYRPSLMKGTEFLQELKKIKQNSYRLTILLSKLDVEFAAEVILQFNGDLICNTQVSHQCKDVCCPFCKMMAIGLTIQYRALKTIPGTLVIVNCKCTYLNDRCATIGPRGVLIQKKCMCYDVGKVLVHYFTNLPKGTIHITGYSKSGWIRFLIAILRR